MGASFFSTLPAWQLHIFVVVFCGVCVAIEHAISRTIVKRQAYSYAAEQVRAIGTELRRGGYLMRARLVEAAAEVVRAFGESRRLPPLFWRTCRGIPPENPVERFIRELRHPTKPAKLLPPPKPKREARKVLTVLPNFRNGAAR